MVPWVTAHPQGHPWYNVPTNRVMFIGMYFGYLLAIFIILISFIVDFNYVFFKMIFTMLVNDELTHH